MEVSAVVSHLHSIKSNNKKHTPESPTFYALLTGQSLDGPRPAKPVVPVSQEVKDAYTAEAKAFASRLATQLQDAEGLSVVSLHADTFYVLTLSTPYQGGRWCVFVCVGVAV